MHDATVSRANAQDDGKGFAILPVPSPGRLFTASEGYKLIQTKMPKTEVNHSVKATFVAGTTHSFAFVGQSAIPKRPQRLMIQDVIPTSGIDANAVSFLQLTTQPPVNSILNVAEGAAKPAYSGVFTPKTNAVVKAAISQKVTDELYTDGAGLQGYIDNLLLYQLAIAVDNMIYNQIIADSAAVATNLDGISEAIGTVRKYGNEPDAVVISAVDFAKLQKSPSANQFMYDEATEFLVPRLYGVPVIFNEMKPGFAFACCFALGAQAFFKQEISIDSTNSSDDDFVKNLVTLRAEARLTVAEYIPACFIAVTIA